MTHFIGNDISKLDFHAALSEDREVIKFTNDRKGINEFIRCLKKSGYSPDQTVIGMESTGSYHLLASLMCKKAGYKVKIINPLIVKNRNKVNLRRVKNDRHDARLIRYSLSSGDGHPFTETEETLKLKTLVRQRRYLAGLKCTFKLKQQNMELHEACIKRSITRVNLDMHEALGVRIKALDKELLKYNKELQKLLRSIPGVGPLTAVSFISEVGDIKRFPAPKKLVAFIGLDPRVHQSGTSIHGKGYISKRGSKLLRTYLFNAASVAVIHPPNIFYDFFQKKISEGKPYRVALCAVMRKMVHVIHAIWSRGTPFVKER